MKEIRLDFNDAGIRGYLLGVLPEAEAEALEEAYLARPDVLERMRGIEDDLLDDYAAGRLDPGETAAFESRILASPLLRERVTAARAIRLALDDAAARSVRRPAAAAADRPRARIAAHSPRRDWPLPIAAGVLLALAAFWLWPRRAPEVASIPTPPLATEPTPRTEPPAHTGPATPTPPATVPVVLALSPGLLRGEDRPAELRVPAGADVVVLELEGDPSMMGRASALEASVKTVEGREAWHGEALRATGGGRPSLLASARVPAARLVPGDYLVRLSTPDRGGTTLYRYFFRVPVR